MCALCHPVALLGQVHSQQNSIVVSHVLLPPGVATSADSARPYRTHERGHNSHFSRLVHWLSNGCKWLQMVTERWTPDGLDRYRCRPDRGCGADLLVVAFQGKPASGGTQNRRAPNRTGCRNRHCPEARCDAGGTRLCGWSRPRCQGGLCCLSLTIDASARARASLDAVEIRFRAPRSGWLDDPRATSSSAERTGRLLAPSRDYRKRVAGGLYRC